MFNSKKPPKMLADVMRIHEIELARTLEEKNFGRDVKTGQHEILERVRSLDDTVGQICEKLDKLIELLSYK